MTTNVNTSGVVFNDATTQNTSSAFVSRTFSANATWTPTKPGLKAVRVTLLGGGGNGGTATGNTQPGTPGSFTPQGKGGVVNPAVPAVPRSAAGGSGGGAGYSQAWINGTVVPASVALTVGIVGGTSSFGSLATATGGGNGTAATATTGANATPGAGGAAGTGTTTANGTIDVQFSATGTAGGTGNVSGGAAAGVKTGEAGAASSGAATGLGNGGGGSTATGAGAVSPGGAGTRGYVIVEEFY